MFREPCVIFRSANLYLLAVVLALPPLAAQQRGYSLRFFGNGGSAPFFDRVDIPLDDPERPVDVGATDFTIEMWLKANSGDNFQSGCLTGKDGWVFRHIFFDRDINGDGDYGDFGMSLGGGLIGFGVSDDSSGETLCSSSEIDDGQWHHIAGARRTSDGRMWLWIDGVQEASGSGPSGDVSYRNGRPTSFPWDPYLTFGAEKHGGDYSFSGWLDEVRLSTSIRYSGSFTPPSVPFLTDADTAALYHFDEGSGNVVGDSSGASGGPSDGTRVYGGNPAGPVWTTDTPFSSSSASIFSDDFELGDLSAWSGWVGAGLQFVQPGLLGTSRALAIDLEVARRKTFVRSRHPRRERSLAVDFMLSVNRVNLGSGAVEILRIGTSKAYAQLKLERDDRGYWAALYARNNRGPLQLVGRTRLPPSRAVHLAIEWRSASTQDSSDGVVRLLKNGKRKVETTDLENGRQVISQVRFGVVMSDSPAEDSGDLILDEYASGRWIS